MMMRRILPFLERVPPPLLVLGYFVGVAVAAFVIALTITDLTSR
jgi:hypothetical protein